MDIKLVALAVVGVFVALVLLKAMTKRPSPTPLHERRMTPPTRHSGGQSAGSRNVRTSRSSHRHDRYNRHDDGFADGVVTGMVMAEAMDSHDDDHSRSYSPSFSYSGYGGESSYSSGGDSGGYSGGGDSGGGGCD